MLPERKILAYGYNSAYEADWRSQGMFKDFTIITGKSMSDGALAEFEGNGGLFACQCPISAYTTEFNTILTSCPSDDLIPEYGRKAAEVMARSYGTKYRAIAWDEWLLDSSIDPQNDKNRKYRVILEAIKSMKTIAPDKVFMVWVTSTGWYQKGAKPWVTMSIAAPYVDVFLVECYMTTGTNATRDMLTQIDNVYAVLSQVPEFAAKSFFVPVTNDDEDEPFDTDPNVDNGAFLERSIRYILTSDKFPLIMKGIGAYAISDLDNRWKLTRPRTALLYAKLANHYLDGNTNPIIGTGIYKNWLSNPLFENGLLGWIPLGDAQVVNIADIIPVLWHGSSYYHVPRGNVLRLVNGEAVRSLSLPINTEFRLRIYSRNHTTPKSLSGNVSITNFAGQSLVRRHREDVTHQASLVSSMRTSDQCLWFRHELWFNSMDGNVVLRLGSSIPNSQTLFDFVDLNMTYGLPDPDYDKASL